MSEEVIRAINDRWSCRAFAEHELSDDLIMKLVRVMLRAPSAGNVQPWHFYLVTSDAAKRGLADAAYGQEFLSQVSVVIVVCAIPAKAEEVYGERGAGLYCIQDTAAAVENLLIAAESIGLGTCWVGAFNETQVSEVLDIPQERRPVAMVPIGKPANPRKRSRRVPESEVLTWVR